MPHTNTSSVITMTTCVTEQPNQKVAKKLLLDEVRQPGRLSKLRRLLESVS